MSDERKTLVERLAPEKLNRLRNLTSEIVHERITVSFAIDERDPNGRKQSAFFSTTVRRKGDDLEAGAGWSNDELRVIRLAVSKQVVGIVYEEAVLKRMLTPSQAAEELKPILEAYDVRIAKLLGDGAP